jgi:hypothetical protein
VIFVYDLAENDNSWHQLIFMDTTLFKVLDNNCDCKCCYKDENHDSQYD